MTSPDSQTPYSTPETDECLSESAIVQMKRPVLPPLELWRLAGTIAMVTGILVAVWALVHHEQYYCFVIVTICAGEISRMLDPHHLRFGSNSFHSFLGKLAGSGVFIAFGVVWIWWRDLLLVPAVMQHPATYGATWLIGCGLILMDWWKRRNNPPYQPVPEVDPTAFSRWKRLRRLGIRE